MPITCSVNEYQRTKWTVVVIGTIVFSVLQMHPLVTVALVLVAVLAFGLKWAYNVRNDGYTKPTFDELERREALMREAVDRGRELAGGTAPPPATPVQPQGWSPPAGAPILPGPPTLPIVDETPIVREVAPPAPPISGPTPLPQGDRLFAWVGAGHELRSRLLPLPPKPVILLLVEWSGNQLAVEYLARYGGVFASALHARR